MLDKTQFSLEMELGMSPCSMFLVSVTVVCLGYMLPCCLLVHEAGVSLAETHSANLIDSVANVNATCFASTSQI